MQKSSDQQHHYPIAIIGGGPAGSAAGALLARAGWDVAIFERDAFPRDKLCGEFLSGESRRLLTEIGCFSALQRHSPPQITRARFISTTGTDLVVPLPEPALGVSRQLLDQVLFEHACACGADGFTNSEVREIITTDAGARQVHVFKTGQSNTAHPKHLTAELILCAYGRRAKLDHDLQRPSSRANSDTVAFKLHHRVAAGADGETAMQELHGQTEIYGLDGGYCGVNLVEGGIINVCMLLQRRAFDRVRSNKWNELNQFLSQGNPALARRLRGLVPVNQQVLSVAGMSFKAKEQSLDGLLYLGDAAGMIAPMCGDGQAMALESGVRAAKLINRFAAANGLAAPQLSKEWQTIWKRRYATRLRVGYALQSALLRPVVSNAAMHLLRHTPALTNFLASITRSHTNTSATSAITE